MKRLPFPPVNDVVETTALSNNTKLRGTSFPHLKNSLNEIKRAYTQYDNSCGDALALNPIGIGADLSNGLRTNYSHPPASLSYIGVIRTSSPLVCPMCGSLKTSTVDHLLPKDVYPEYSIYSRNLVPACDCNSKRGVVLKDVAKRVRILHPYYDNCLSQRQLSSVFIESPMFPKVRIEVRCIQAHEALIDSIRFHVNNVVIPSGLIKWLSDRWASLAAKPEIVIQTLPRRAIYDENELRSYLADALSRYDALYETPNNWYSIFVHGLLESPRVTAWLLMTHNNYYP